MRETQFSMWIVISVFGLLTACDGTKQASFNQEPLTVLIVRHGEKPEKGDNLSCQGQHRALQLPQVLADKQLVPNQIVVPALNQGEHTSHSRMYQTATPTAVRFNVDINTDFDAKDEKKAAQYVQSQHGLVLMVWSHTEIPKLAKALGVHEVPQWSDADFDSVWRVDVAQGQATLTRLSEGLQPNSDCRF